MKRKLILGLLILALIAVPMFAAACGEEEPTPPAQQEEEEEEEEEQPPPVEQPEYGGTIVQRVGFVDVITDPGDPRSAQYGCWLEGLFTDDRSVPVDEYSFEGNYTPIEYRTGQLADSWEYKAGDPTTVIVNLRQGVIWQGIPTAGREFTSDDVVFTYDMVLGVGEFAGSQPDAVFSPLIPAIDYVEATGPYTVEFHFKAAGPFAVNQVVCPSMDICVRPREWYDLTDEQKADWHYVTGTGAFVMTDFVTGTSITTTANDEYYLEDARYPGNKLPYADELKFIVIPDMDTSLSALRTGEVDLLIDARVYPTLSQTQELMASNPEINVYNQAVAAPALFFAWDTEAGVILPPFDDIRIRTAMQMAIDNALIAETYYQGTVESDLVGLMSEDTGWGYPFSEWPAELQAEYTYDLEGAQALMADAGVTSLDTTILTTADDYPEVLEIWQGMFKEIGVNMTINAMDMMSQRPVVQQGDFELLWSGAVGSGNSAPPDAIQSFYEGKFESIGQGARANDPYYNSLVEDFLAATTLDECHAIFKDADQYWLEQHWLVIGFPTLSYQMTQPWIKGYEGQHLWSLTQWGYYMHMWVDESLK
jgi:ABC-type transport system substrate-binding protein